MNSMNMNTIMSKNITLTKHEMTKKAFTYQFLQF